MKHLDTYKIFEKKTSSYSDRYEYYTGNKAQPGFSSFLYDFFKGMNDRFKNYNSYYKDNLAPKDVSGRTIDTGLGALIGAAGSLASSVARGLKSSLAILSRQTSRSYVSIRQHSQHTSAYVRMRFS